MGNIKNRLICLITIIMLEALSLALGVFKIQSDSVRLFNERVLEVRDEYRRLPLLFFQERKYNSYYEHYLNYTNCVLKEAVVFPVPAAYRGVVAYEDSFGTARTYGGERSHEGTDIMHTENKPGTVPVVSMTDGYVKNIGWLKLGGYRIGILSDSGMYYYYAHLDSYAPGIAEGSEIHAGEFIGMMGDTGYGEEEGTRGQFPVHLHLGIYYYDDRGNEISINPYPFLKCIDVINND